MSPAHSPAPGGPVTDLNSVATPDAFEPTDDVLWLNTAGAAPRLRAVTAAAQRALTDSARPWTAPADAWIEQTESLRALAATLLHTQADALAYTPSVSYAMALAARNLPLQGGDNVVVLAREYPSNRTVWQLGAQRVGAVLRAAAARPGEDWTAAVLGCIDARTAVICIPHCHWADGALLDLAVIADAARSAHAALVIDASQSLGILELDLDRLGADFVVAPGHKWLLGPYGLGWLWASPRWREHGVPLEQTALARLEVLGDFTTRGAHLPPYRPGARRFDFGPYPHPLSVPMAEAALQQIQRWGGVAALSSRLGGLSAHLRTALSRHGLLDGLRTPHAPHLCAWVPPAGARDRVMQALVTERIIAAQRGDGIRIAPHLHVSAEDLDRLARVLAAAC